jgi:hypothetical protein
MKIKTFKIFSYCDDFKGEDDMQETLSEYGECDTYIEYRASKEEDNSIGNLLVELGADEGEMVLIHLDW